MIDYLIMLALGVGAGYCLNNLFPFLKNRKQKAPVARDNGTAVVFRYDESKEEKEASDLSEQIWHQEETSFVFKINDKFAHTFDRRQVAGILVEDTLAFMNATRCVLLLLDEESGRLRVEYASGPDTEPLKDFSVLKSESVAGSVFKSKEPLMVNDLRSDYYNSINKEPYLRRSFVSVPLIVKGEAFGILTITDKKTGAAFHNKDLELLVNVARPAAIAFKNIRLFEQIQEGYLKTITTLAMLIDARDPYTRRHSENVTRYSVLIARELGLATGLVDLIKRAGLLHDIGKVAIRDDVLLKPGRLSPEEFEIIKSHAAKGEEIVRSLPFLKEVAGLVRSHHERFDGSGYPDGKKGEAIALGARILAVADSFDAMTTNRPYRNQLTLEQAVAEIRKNRGGQFDPAVADCFVSLIGRDPGLMNQREQSRAGILQ